MKKLSILISTLVIGGVFLFISCTKTGPQGPTGATGPVAPVTYGTISGNVLMYNQYGAAVTNNYTGGYITLKNATTGATIDSVIASSTGSYSMSNIPTGTYNMYCVYAGYGLNEHENLQLTGTTSQVDNKIAAIPNFNVTTADDSVGTTHKDNTSLFISGSIAADPNGSRTLLIFAGNSPSVSSAPSMYSFIITKTIPQDSTTYSFTIPLTTIYNNGFAYGNSIYFAIYGASNNYTYGDYTNYTYGQLVYTAISPTSVIPSPSVITLP